VSEDGRKKGVKEHGQQSNRRSKGAPGPAYRKKQEIRRRKNAQAQSVRLRK
jgi:hypothetical protein